MMYHSENLTKILNIFINSRFDLAFNMRKLENSHQDSISNRHPNCAKYLDSDWAYVIVVESHTAHPFCLISKIAPTTIGITLTDPVPPILESLFSDLYDKFQALQAQTWERI
jgi:hypothetical protein